ncbi:MAG: N-acetyl-gamma-glutamyl-phosphate reductase [Coraliomargaritaceae bacterium]
MKTAIVGASGYSGEELIRLLSQHPEAELCAVTSRSLAGQKVADHLPKLSHIVKDLTFTESSPQALAENKEIDTVFLALPHGVSFEYAEPLFEAGKTIIDLSADFRLNSPSNYEKYYGKKHPAPQLLDVSPYVIPEISHPKWLDAQLIACPGCYPTSILIPLIPLFKAGQISHKNVVINSYSGVSGAGKTLNEGLLYTNVNESLKAYGLPTHRHLSEISEQLDTAAFEDVSIQFCPHLAPINRGIHTTIVVPAKVSIETIYAQWEKAYGEAPFVKILPSGTFPEIKNVVGSNRIDFSAVYDKQTENLIITSVIDNLIKGASGQAVQIFNKKFAFPETMGLL